MNITMYYSSKTGKPLRQPEDSTSTAVKMPSLTITNSVTAQRGTKEFDAKYISHVNDRLKKRLSKVHLDFEREQKWVDEQMKRIEKYKNGENAKSSDISFLNSKAQKNKYRPTILSKTDPRRHKSMSIETEPFHSEAPTISSETPKEGLWKIPFTVIDRQGGITRFSSDSPANNSTIARNSATINSPFQDFYQPKHSYQEEAPLPTPPPVITIKAQTPQDSLLLNGEFDEAESAQSFQDALRAWRLSVSLPSQPQQKQIVKRNHTASHATQSVGDSLDARGITAPEKKPLTLKFSENDQISYFDRLLIKTETQHSDI